MRGSPTRTSVLARVFRNVLLPAMPAALAAGSILYFPPDPRAHVPLLTAAIAMSLVSCILARILWTPGAAPVFRLSVHASLLAVSGWMAWYYVSWCLAQVPGDLLQAAREFPDHFGYLGNWLRDRHGTVTVMAMVVSPAVSLVATGASLGTLSDMLSGDKPEKQQPNWARRASEAMSSAMFALAPLWTTRSAASSSQLVLAASPAAAAALYFLLGPHPHEAQIEAMLMAGGISAVVCVLIVKPRSRRWRLFLLSTHAGAAAIASTVFHSYLSWWLSQLPDNPLYAAWRFPRLLADHIEWLQAQYGEFAGLSPVFSAGIATFSGFLALEQAFRLARSLGQTEAGRPRAKSRLYGSARFMPRHHMRRLSRQPGGLILGAESKSPRSRLVSYPLAGAALTLAPPRSGKTATVALNLLNPGGAGFRGSTIVVDPRGELWCVTAQRRLDMDREVLLLDPFGVVRRLKEEWPQLEDLPCKSLRWNPLDFVRDGPKGVGDLDVILDALLTPPATQADAARHFYDAARAIIGGFLAWVRFGPGMDGGRTLETARMIMLSDKKEAAQIAEAMGEFPDMAFGRVAEAVKRMDRVGAQEAGSNFSTIANQLDWLRFPELQEDTLESDFDVRSICDGNTDLYVVAPPRLLEQVRAWIRLWIAVPDAIASEHVGPGRENLLIILDEMPKLGYLAPVMNAFTMAAGAGVHFWCIIQSLSALETSYGQRNAELLTDNSELNQILGFPNTAAGDAERFSAALGTATFRAPSRGQTGSNSDASESVVRERLVPVHDLLSMDGDTQYVVASPRGMPRDALRLAHARYWERDDIVGAGENPYVLRKA